MSLPLDRDAIAARIPHHGGMCLLERATEATPERIVCTAVSHHAAGNPLRMDGRLSAVHAIEYAAQAMALHRSFAEGAAEPAPRGMLTSVRDVLCHVERLDDIPDELTIVATRLAGDGITVLYGFSVCDGARALVTGRASAVLDAGRVAPR
jgi:predicted hotdog family 3-hydroxylacyl-ACP dehydratase